jgi:hypothetical protein
MDVKSAKFSNRCIFLQNDFTNNIKKFLDGARGLHGW